jgi:hypothetical protein
MHRLCLSAASLFCQIIFSVNQSHAQGVGRIEGDWNNESGWNMHVTRDDFGGYDASLGCCGDGRITASTTVRGANIKLEGSNWECWYNANVLRGDSTMNWRWIAGQGRACQTAAGFFYRK